VYAVRRSRVKGEWQVSDSDYKKSLGRSFGAATPPGALVRVCGRGKGTTCCILN